MNFTLVNITRKTNKDKTAVGATWVVPAITPKGEGFESQDPFDALNWALWQCDLYEKQTGRIKIPTLSDSGYSALRCTVTLGGKAIARLGLTDAMETSDDTYLLPVYNIRFLPMPPADSSGLSVETAMSYGLYFGTVIYKGKWASVCTSNRVRRTNDFTSFVWTNLSVQRMKGHYQFPDNPYMKDSDPDNTPPSSPVGTYGFNIDELTNSIKDISMKLSEAAGSFVSMQQVERQLRESEPDPRPPQWYASTNVNPTEFFSPPAWRQEYFNRPIFEEPPRFNNDDPYRRIEEEIPPPVPRQVEIGRGVGDGRIYYRPTNWGRDRFNDLYQYAFQPNAVEETDPTDTPTVPLRDRLRSLSELSGRLREFETTRQNDTPEITVNDVNALNEIDPDIDWGRRNMERITRIMGVPTDIIYPDNWVDNEAESHPATFIDGFMPGEHEDDDE